MADPFSCEVSRLRDETFQMINTKGRKSCQEMEKLWFKIYGPNRDVVVERYQTIEKHISELFDEMVKEETENFDERRMELDNLVKMSDELRKELSIKIELPFKVNLDGSYLRQQIKDLKNYLVKYKQIREDRLRSLQQYKLDEEKLCEKLGQEPVYGSFDEVPSEAKLKEMKTRLSTLNAELLKRSKTFKSLISEIKELVQDLEIENDLYYDQRNTLAGKDDAILSEQKLIATQEWKRSLLEQRDTEEQLVSSLKDQTMMLWNRLDVSPEERERVLVQTRKTYGKTVIDLWTKELDRCQELKKANTKTVILRLRAVIADLWNDCHIDAEQRALFADYFSEDFNEQVLESHEKEEQNLRKYYEETKDLYDLAEKWFSLWNKMVSLDSRSTNAERLNNRGGQLLKEEKEQSAVQKELPKVESKLENRIAAFEQSHGRTFLYEGHPLMELIAEYWDNQRIEKENEKEVTKIQNQTRVTPSAKSNSRLVAPSPLSGSRKRGRPMPSVETVPVTEPVAKRQLKEVPEAAADEPVGEAETADACRRTYRCEAEGCPLTFGNRVRRLQHYAETPAHRPQGLPCAACGTLIRVRNLMPIHVYDAHREDTRVWVCEPHRRGWFHHYAYLQHMRSMHPDVDAKKLRLKMGRPKKEKPPLVKKRIGRPKGSKNRRPPPPPPPPPAPAPIVT